MKKFCAEFILSSVVVFSFSVFSFQSAFAGSWISAEWKRRIPLTVNNSAGALTDYQLYVPTGIFSSTQWADIKGGNGKANLDDLRFYNSDSSVSLPYWIEDNTTTPRGFWVKFSGTLPNGTTTIYLYYANPSATAGSNGDNTFMLFDDFSGTILDTNKWIWYNPDNAFGYETNNSEIRMYTITKGSYSAGITQANVFPQDILVERKIRFTDTYREGVQFLLTDSNIATKDSRVGAGPSESSGTRQLILWYASGAGAQQVQLSGVNLGTNTNYLLHTFRVRSGFYIQTSLSNYGGSSIWTSSEFQETYRTWTQMNRFTGMSVWHETSSDATNNDLYIDWIRVRKYVSSEPTVSAGTVETVPPQIGSLNAMYDLVNDVAIISGSTTTHNTPYFYWEVTLTSNPVIGYSLTISTNDTEPDATVDLTTSYYEWTAEFAGKYYFRVKAKDSAGSWGDSLLFIYLYSPDTSLPQVTQTNLNGEDTNGNVILGLPQNTVLENRFTKTMDKTSLTEATVLKAVRNHNGNEISLTIPGTVTYDLTEKKLTFVPQSPLPKGYTFELVVSTLAKDTEGNTLSKAILQKFTTIMDYSLDNTVVGEDKKTKLQIPAKSIAKDYYVKIDTNPVDVALSQANEKIKKDFAYQALPGTMREFKVLDETKNYINSQLKQAVKITLPLPEGYSKESAIWYLDETRSLWVKIPTTLDTQDNTLTASAPHLSIYAVFNSASSGVDEVYAYPVPWRPNKGDPQRYGTLTDGITFTNLPNPVSIRIYNLAGELVREIANLTSPTYPWNGKTENGNPVASGVYIYVVESAEKRKTGKLVIVR